MANYVKIESRGDIALVTLNRPERRNALGSALLDDLISVFTHLEQDQEVRAVVLTGAGTAFCAGADLKEFGRARPHDVAALNTRISAFMRSILVFPKPVIAAVNGAAMGGGFVLAASCDSVVTTPTARWHLPEVSLGWLPGFGLHILSLKVGINRARRLTLASEPTPGEQAFRIGLADMVSHIDQTPVELALEEATKLATLPAHSVATAKRYFALEANSTEKWDVIAQSLYAEDALHPEAQKAMQRFQK
ncbi:enoyl-CoA hydratase/isomerase family protein [Halomonas dongshanensis]|uniref:Enoyl-CoA hydratase/isomerase family protein n=1 Tax=Halomonas dongshanensis TaxID=2890835 RepID=A0ABT2ECA6_9GAMM|nr:enoyl-CoA hydratase/isomerase family protein [Halomonas dongshanensis]MCS2608735.1 enoyl-CoA hydratase/isomerase family protein [Halomonas dongshanensis]